MNTVDRAGREKAALAKAPKVRKMNIEVKLSRGKWGTDKLIEVLIGGLVFALFTESKIDAFKPWECVGPHGKVQKAVRKELAQWRAEEESR